MNTNLTVHKSIEIEADPMTVYNALLDRDKLKACFFGADVSSDWKAGSAVSFTGEYQTKSYHDKGIVQQAEPGKVLSYTYWSGFSGMEDKPENYSLVSYTIDAAGRNSVLGVTQQGFANEQGYKHSQTGWESVLSVMKKLIEQP